MRLVLCSCIALSLVSPALEAQVLPRSHPIGPLLSSSTEPLASVSQVRELTNGRVLVNDISGRRLVLFDSTLKHFSVIADSTSATSVAYGSRLGGLISFRGDSSLFVDPASLSILVVDPLGKIVRTIAVPRPNDVQNLIGGPFGTPALDPSGRLVYRANIRSTAAGSPASAFPQTFPDSALIVRFDFSARTVDTVAKFAIPKVKFGVIHRDDGIPAVSLIGDPMPVTDDWALLANGDIAIVRGREYRVDFINLNGRVTRGPKLPFEWKRLSDEDKVAIIDSTRDADKTARLKWIASQPLPASSPSTGSGGRERALPEATMTRSSSSPSSQLSGPQAEYVAPSELPDYRPAFRQGAARGDLKGNLWIRTTQVVDGEAIYDVVNAVGVVTERVRVPRGRVIVGFGRGDVVYMAVTDGSTAKLERARVH
jgi:hypothetical protein